MFSACFSAPPRLRVKQHLSNSTRSRPRRNSRRAEREVRRNLILGPCLPSPCQHRNAPDLRYPPHAALVSLPPQREPRCEAVRSPLSPRSQVLTFLRSLASSEANPEKMFSPCFSAPPRLRVKQHLSNSTRSQPRRNSRRAEREVRRNLILGPCLPSPCQHRNAPDQLRYPPRAALVSLPPQREPRCEAVRSPLRSRTISAVSALAGLDFPA